MSSTAPRAQTGVPGLDDILAGGVPRGRIYLLKGAAGAGKTTLGMQYLLTGAAADERGLYVALSENRAELEEVAHSHGWDLGPIEIQEIESGGFKPEEDNTLFVPAEVELGETTQRILEAVERTRPSRVVIDSLSEIRFLSGTEIRYRRQVLALKQVFMRMNCTALLVDDKAQSQPDALLESIAHGVIELEQLVPKYGPERRRLLISKMRGVRYRGGYHDMRLKTGGLRVFPRLIPGGEHSHPFHPEQIPSGLAELDQLVGGGLDRGTTNLIMGPAGTGKSALAAQYLAAAAARGENGVLLMFEESRETLFGRTRALGIPLIEQVDAGRIRILQVNPVEISPGEFAQMVRDAVEEHGARHVAIDSLNGYFNALPEENFLELQLHELFRYLRQLGVTVLLTLAQQGVVGLMGPSVIDLSYLADTLILLRYFEAAGQIRKAISVPKKRGGAHESTIRELAMDKRGFLVGEPLTAFRGVLTGVPEYTGAASNDLLPELERNESA